MASPPWILSNIGSDKEVKTTRIIAELLPRFLPKHPATNQTVITQLCLTRECLKVIFQISSTPGSVLCLHVCICGPPAEKNQWGWDNFSSSETTLSECKLCWMQSSQGLGRKLEDLLSATFHRYIGPLLLSLYTNSFLPPALLITASSGQICISRRERNAKLMGELLTIVFCFLVMVNEAWADPHLLLILIILLLSFPQHVWTWP